jgi:hypothetical protein
MSILKRSTLSTAPDSFIFMKIGSHAGETLEQILERKQREIEHAGRSFWGYGGASCHPLTQVQPFARSVSQQSSQVYLLMEYIHSTADPDIVPATEYSSDGVRWEKIPEGINVTGSRYALVLDEILPGELELPLHNYSVGIGQSRGKSASEYLTGRVDKGCLVRDTSEGVDANISFTPRKAKYVARLVAPYGVLLK